MQRFISEVAAQARSLTSQALTVGSASARWLSLVEGLDLDFYQVHWYDRIDRAPPTEAVARWAPDRPVLLGELPTHGSAHTPEALVHMAEVAGYSGVLLWSLLAEDEASNRERGMRALDAQMTAQRTRGEPAKPVEAASS